MKSGCGYRLALGIGGLVGGYFLAVFIRLMLAPNSPQGPIPFIVTVWPITAVCCFIWGSRLDARSNPINEQKGFDVILPSDGANASNEKRN